MYEPINMINDKTKQIWRVHEAKTWISENINPVGAISMRGTQSIHKTFTVNYFFEFCNKICFNGFCHTYRSARCSSSISLPQKDGCKTLKKTLRTTPQIKELTQPHTQWGQLRTIIISYPNHRRTTDGSQSHRG